MGYQFQSIAAVGPFLISESIVTYTQLGTLIGIYLLPGAFIAIPGGWFGRRFGDKRVVLCGLAMMTLGGALLALTEDYGFMFAGRLVSGIGAVLLNVLVTKMVTDWFAEYRITSAMGILISSWPLGIALALLTMNPIVNAFGIQVAYFVPTALCAAALVLVGAIYTRPPGSPDSGHDTGHVGPSLSRYEFLGVFLSGCVWCFYNIAFILVLSFSPEVLVAKGLTIISAGAIVSLASWLVIPALPIGALVAEKIGRPTGTIVISLLFVGLLTMAIPYTSADLVIFAVIGIIFGPAGGLIMALPVQVLRKQNRAIGMGIFFTIYYIGMGIFPAIAGYTLEITANPAAPLFLSVLAIVLAVTALIAYRMLQSRNSREESAL